MRPHLLLGLSICLLACGCGGEKLAPVSGQVTLNNQPLPNATVTFQPIPKEGSIEAGPESVGQTDNQGRFTLEMPKTNSKGAVVGKHKVMISALQGPPPDPKDDNPKPRKELVPARYNTETELTFEVPAGGTDKADFALKGH